MLSYKEIRESCGSVDEAIEVYAERLSAEYTRARAESESLGNVYEAVWVYRRTQGVSVNPLVLLLGGILLKEKMTETVVRTFHGRPSTGNFSRKLRSMAFEGLGVLVGLVSLVASLFSLGFLFVLEGNEFWVCAAVLVSGIVLFLVSRYALRKSRVSFIPDTVPKDESSPFILTAFNEVHKE